jgi:hypothetical protein
MAHYEVRADQAGHFDIGGLAPGEYLLEAERSGFRMTHESLTVEPGEHLQQDRHWASPRSSTRTSFSNPSVEMRPARTTGRWTVPRRDCVPIEASLTITIDFNLQP